MTDTYKIKPLTGEENYKAWKAAMENICVVDNILSIIRGIEKRPNEQDEPIPPLDDEDPSKWPTFKEEMRQCMIELKEHRKEQKEWDKRNLLARSRIRLSCEESPQVHIEDMEDAAEMWKTLRRYEKPSSTVVTKAFIKLTQADLTEFDSIRKYAEHIQALAKRCKDANREIPGFIQQILFIKGLTKDLEPYVFKIIESNEGPGKSLSFEHLITSLINHKERVKVEKEDGKTLYTRKPKENKDLRILAGNT